MVFPEFSMVNCINLSQRRSVITYTSWIQSYAPKYNHLHANLPHSAREKMCLLVVWLFIGLVTTMLPFSSPHPQCLDFQPPFEDDRITYCDEYKDFGCCTYQLDLDVLARVESVYNLTQLPPGQGDRMKIASLTCIM